MITYLVCKRRFQSRFTWNQNKPLEPQNTIKDYKYLSKNWTASAHKSIFVLSEWYQTVTQISNINVKHKIGLDYRWTQHVCLATTADVFIESRWSVFSCCRWHSHRSNFPSAEKMKGSAISTCRVWSISILSISWEIKTINDHNRYLRISVTMTTNGLLNFANQLLANHSNFYFLSNLCHVIVV